MAKEVIIRILAEQPSSPSPDAGTNSSEQSAVSNDGKSSKKADKEKDSFGKAFYAVVARRIVNVVKNEAVHYANKYLDASENYRAQMMVTNASNTIDAAVGTFVSGKVAAAAFSSAGMSAAVGGFIGAAVYLGVKTVSAAREFGNEYESIIKSTYGNYFYGERAGFVSGGHGTEN